MAIDRGIALTVYLLMSKLSDGVDGKSSLRTEVDRDIAVNLMSPRDALIGQVHSQLRQDISAIGPLADFQPANLTGALGIPYTGAGCPGRADQIAVTNALAGNV